MIKPKRGYARTVHLASKESPAKFCENPQCGAKLSREAAREGYKHCDRTCLSEHRRIQAVERRPKDVRCSFCQKPLDTMRAAPSYWSSHELHFCDGICTDGYRRQSGHYAEMSKLGYEKAAEYKEKHGKVYSHEDRSEAVSRNKRGRPPKAKHFIREGYKAWGYDVRFYPDENDEGYRVSVPELDEELGTMKSKTVKGGLRMVRERIVELRIQEAKQEAQGENNVRN